MSKIGAQTLGEKTSETRMECQDETVMAHLNGSHGRSRPAEVEPSPATFFSKEIENPKQLSSLGVHDESPHLLAC